MKHTITVLLVLISAFSFAQDSIKVNVETPKIVSQLPLGEAATFDTITIKFVELVGDSRCPEGVTCVWAGEVVVLVAVFKDGEKLERKKITFNARGEAKDIYVSEDLTISGLKVTPYPVYEKKIALEDYKMELYVTN
ncbi:hypothetical protein [Lacinutrix sp. Hel_I_90]|uniref:hypothetical protein n=1 Tax=Lacinutrix sp. Hel_I_90 TaxID=1249999 RepID=UPI000695E8A2|nr:hypothetical protein [Lacinutrix sp. Hel_I_90]